MRAWSCLALYVLSTSIMESRWTWEASVMGASLLNSFSIIIEVYKSVISEVQVDSRVHFVTRWADV